MRSSTLGMALAIVAAGVGAVVLFAQGQALQEDVADTIRHLEATRRQALLDGNADVVASLLADDFVEIAATGTIRRKRDNAADLRSGRLKWLEATATDENVRVFDSFAVFTATMRNRGTMAGEPWNRFARVSRIYALRDGKWLCVHAQSTA